MKNLLIILIVLIAQTAAKASVIVDVRGINYAVDAVYGNGWDGYNVLSQMAWWDDSSLAKEFSTAVGLQLGYTNNGFSDVAKPLFGYYYASNQRWMVSQQYAIDILGNESTNQIKLGMGSTAYYAIASQVTVPIPPALWLFGSGLLGLIGMTRKKAA